MPETTSRTVVATGRTGAMCLESGPYVSADSAKAGNVIVFFRKGQPFPVNTDGTVTSWTMVRDGKQLVDGRVVSEPTDKV